MQRAREAKLATLQAADVADQDPVEIAKLKNDIAATKFEMNQPVPYELTADEKTQWDTEWKAFSQRKDRLVKNRGQAYSLVLGQCTQLLQDQMKQDANWTAVSTSSDPLQLYRLIERTVATGTNRGNLPLRYSL